MIELARVFGDAIYELAKEENTLDVTQNELKFIDEMLKENPDFGKILDAPSISSKEKISMIDTCFLDKIEVNTLNFIKLLSSRSIVSYFGISVKEFNKRRDTDEGVIEVTAVTAVALNDEQIAQLKEKLKNMYPENTIRLNTKVDDSIMGGMKLQFNDKQLDGSVKTILESMKKAVLKADI